MRKLLAANWKMFLTLQEAQELITEVLGICESEVTNNVATVFCAPMPYLQACHHLVKHTARFSVGAQNCHHKEQGAFTGETSAKMLASLGVKYCIIGHSERRQYFKEDNALLAAKVKQALAFGLIPIYCLGETLEQRENGTTMPVVNEQLKEGLFDLPEKDFAGIVIAYEPVWAIGTGINASSEQAQEVHAHLRELIKLQYGEVVSTRTSILYGGSMKPDNAKALFECPDIDGGLVGGASLKSRDFVEILKSFK